MRVLWFEVTVPKHYRAHDFHGGGWQDALEQIVKGCNDVDLGIAFENKYGGGENRVVEGVQYFPLNVHYNKVDKIKDLFSWEVTRKKLIPLSLKVIEEFQPDVIHIFGSEWSYGLVSELIDIPVVIHIQGSIPPYNNAFYPPGYNEWDEWIYNFTHFKFHKLFFLPIARKKREDRKTQEEQILKNVGYFMGRTEWDKGLINLYNPTASYFYCSEALRPSFLKGKREWRLTNNKGVRLTTTGCSSLWKGLDTIVRTAKLLTERGIEFEWCLAGNINHKGLVEWKEKEKIENLNIRLLGMIDSDNLVELLMQTDIYIHTAYIDNSPNSICEAQYLGLPIIATYVGGIPSLIENGSEGLLIPPNEPYTLANEIIKLSMDKPRQVLYSENSRRRATARHAPSSILRDLLQVYNSIDEKKR